MSFCSSQIYTCVDNRQLPSTELNQIKTCTVSTIEHPLSPCTALMPLNLHPIAPSFCGEAKRKKKKQIPTASK